jgi:hypothetical protein
MMLCDEVRRHEEGEEQTGTMKQLRNKISRIDGDEEDNEERKPKKKKTNISCLDV